MKVMKHLYALSAAVGISLASAGLHAHSMDDAQALADMLANALNSRNPDRGLHRADRLRDRDRKRAAVGPPRRQSRRLDVLAVGEHPLQPLGYAHFLAGARGHLHGIRPRRPSGLGLHGRRSSACTPRNNRVSAREPIQTLRLSGVLYPTQSLGVRLTFSNLNRDNAGSGDLVGLSANWFFVRNAAVEVELTRTSTGNRSVVGLRDTDAVAVRLLGRARRVDALRRTGVRVLRRTATVSQRVNLALLPRFATWLSTAAW